MEPQIENITLFFKDTYIEDHMDEIKELLKVGYTVYFKKSADHDAIIDHDSGIITIRDRSTFELLNNFVKDEVFKMQVEYPDLQDRIHDSHVTLSFKRGAHDYTKKALLIIRSCPTDNPKNVETDLNTNNPNVYAAIKQLFEYERLTRQTWGELVDSLREEFYIKKEVLAKIANAKRKKDKVLDKLGTCVANNDEEKS